MVPAWSQVVDDSTKQIYSNKSVEYFYENDVLRNIKKIYNPDSTLIDYHYMDPVRKSRWLYQDLGNTGTASRPILFEKQMEIGQQMGREVFNLYAPKVSDFKYYNTRSPYTYLQYQQGGGRTQFAITHSQNINPRLNFTFNIFKANSSKTYGFLRSEEQLVNHWYYDINTNYKSKNNKYQLLSTFYHFNHKQFEQGGVKLKEEQSLALKDIEPSYSDYYEAGLTGTVINRERWNNFRLYQQFVLKNSLQTFHVLDYERKYYSFTDNNFVTEANAPAYLILPTADQDTLFYSYRFHSISNKVGFKGIYKGVNYQAYARYRMYQLTNAYVPEFSKKWTPEFFVGGLLGYVFPDSTNTLDVKAEISHDKYLLDATMFYKGFEIGFYNSSLPVGLFYSNFSNNYLNFNLNPQNFKNINSSHLTGKFPIAYRNFKFIPEARFSNITNYTYMPRVDSVEQYNRSIALMTLKLDAIFKYKNIALTYGFYFNKSSQPDVYAVPKYIHYLNFDYSLLYAKILHINTGFDFYYKSNYWGDNYSPLTAQFHREKRQIVGGVPVLDFYLKFPFSKGRFSISYTYVNKLIGGFADIANFGKKGHFTTPRYLGSPNALMIKIDWPLFD